MKKVLFVYCAAGLALPRALTNFLTCVRACVPLWGKGGARPLLALTNLLACTVGARPYNAPCSFGARARRFVRAYKSSCPYVAP